MVCEDSSSSDYVCDQQTAGGSSSLVELYQQQSTRTMEALRTPYTTELLSSTASTLNFVALEGRQEAERGEETPFMMRTTPPLSAEMTLVTAAALTRASSARGNMIQGGQQHAQAYHDTTEPCLMTHISTTSSHPSCALMTPHHNKFSVLNVIEEALDLLDDFDDEFYGAEWYPQGPPMGSQASTLRGSSRMRHSRDTHGRLNKRHRTDYENQD